MARLELCKEGSLKGFNVDLKHTCLAYNLCYWVGDGFSYVFIPGHVNSLAVVFFDYRYELYSGDCKYAGEAESRLKHALGLEENLWGFHERARNDPLLSQFVAKYPGWRLRSTSLWWALVTAISQQNASFKQGWRILHNIVKLYGKHVLVGGRSVPRPSTPREVLEEPGKLLAAGAGFRAKTMIAVARALEEGSLDPARIEKASPVEAEKELTSISGVGHYTARLAIALSTRKYALPPVDRWLRKVASAVYGIDEKFVEEFWREKWGNWSALAAIAVTIALDAEPLSRALDRVKKHLLSPRVGVSPSPLNMSAFCATT